MRIIRQIGSLAFVAGMLMSQSGLYPNCLSSSITTNRLCIFLVFLLLSVVVSSCYTTGHPVPFISELYEAKDSDNESHEVGKLDS